MYRQWGKYELALEYFQKALEIDEKLKDIRRKATRLNNIGIVYQNWDKPGKALEYFQKSLKLFEELNDAENIAGIMKNIKNLT
ncbi:Photosystem I assembly protein Ycf3 [uncultured archaeon]|nr:Photosystem I assembly protein Ycf3 [uncultured archaeon]